MKELILVRHAKSSWRDPSLDDHSRPLNKRGKRDAPDMGDRLARRGCDPDLLVSSSADRALKTARAFAAKLGYPSERIRIEARLYHASVAELLHVIRGVNDSVGILMLFGHNPGFTHLANLLGTRDIFNMPTCAVLHLRFEMDDWPGIGRADGVWADGGRVAGEEVLYDYPKSAS